MKSLLQLCANYEIIIYYIFKICYHCISGVFSSLFYLFIYKCSDYSAGNYKQGVLGNPLESFASSLVPPAPISCRRILLEFCSDPLGSLMPFLLECSLDSLSLSSYILYLQLPLKTALGCWHQFAGVQNPLLLSSGCQNKNTIA